MRGVRGLARLYYLLEKGACREGKTVLSDSVKVSEGSRNLSNLPADYGQYYNKTDAPRRKLGPQSQQKPLSSGEASTSSNADPAKPSSTADSSSSSLQQQSAASVTGWMFPWEKRQMDGSGGPLRSWERIYWGVFVSAIAYFLYTRISGKDEGTAIDPEEESRKEQLKLRSARLLMAGQPLSAEDEQPFEGLSPKEIQEYVDQAFGKSKSSDPFEGLSPEEINALLGSTASALS